VAKLQSEFNKFHETIKLKQYEENEDLREKRDLLLDELKDKIKDEKVPGTDKKLTFRSINQGSYAMNTGIKPQNDDYDIDVGVIFDVTNDEYKSSDLKKLVRDKLNKWNRTVNYNRPCITVEYLSEDYHVDLAVYSENNDDIHIAWGKESSSEKIWYKSEPEKLTKWVAKVSSDADESAQFRRCVRYLKKWKEKHFTSNGNGAPPSIGLTIQARNAYRKNSSDIDTLMTMVNYIKDSFTNVYDEDTYKYIKSIVVCLPVEPFKNVYYKMSLIQQNNFYEKIDALQEVLVSAAQEESEHKASKLLRKAFGDEFPFVEDIKESKKKPYVTTGNSA
jgi:hypothetical protein